MNFFKKFWFGLLISSIIMLFAIMFLLILLAPRQDAQKRGFIPCTETLAESVLNCEKHKVICLIKAVMANSWCDAKVVGKGVKLWVTGKQSAPWSNYIFIPETSDEFALDNKTQSEYLKNNPDFHTEMQELHKLNEELENEENQQQLQFEEPTGADITGLGLE